MKILKILSYVYGAALLALDEIRARRPRPADMGESWAEAKARQTAELRRRQSAEVHRQRDSRSVLLFSGRVVRPDKPS